MTLPIRRFLMSSLFLVAIALSIWSILSTNRSLAPTKEATPNHPDAFMENVIATVMNKAGKPVLKVETPKMVHFVENDTTDMTTPHVTIFRQSPEPWHINAKHAKALHGVSEIQFWDNVTIHHLADNDNPITTMLTDTLTILPEEQVAKTDKAITVTQPNTTVRAIGMLTNLADGTIQLLSKAIEEYVPNS